jgi:energy-coupling factor transport system ATP-binding protein
VSSTGGPLLSARGLRYSYEAADGRAVAAIDGLDLSIGRGEFVALVGANGSGKSTLARLLVGLLRPSGGRIEIVGVGSDSRGFVPELRKRLGFAFQNPEDQIVRSLVDEDVAFGPGNEGLAASELEDRVSESLEIVGASNLRDRDTRALSGGERQKVAIAGVLARRPQCLILDEPTSMLDPIARAGIMEILLRLNSERGMAVALITQSMDEAVLAGRVVVLRAGRVALEGSPERVFGNGKGLQEMGLGLPFAAEAAGRLREAGVEVRGFPRTVGELAEAICW